MSGIANIPAPRNEPVLSYAPGTAPRQALKDALGTVGGEQPEIPVVAGGEELRPGKLNDVVSPHRHRHVLARVHQADGRAIDSAIAAAVEAQRDWARWPFEDRASVFLKAADLLAGSWRARINAATMLGQSKTAFQAEIDSACELIDFLRFNVHFAERIYAEQPQSSAGMWNRLDHRPLEGFVYAITPFNFTAIGGNLPTAPALMGNAVVWKPSATATLSNWHFFRLLEEKRV
jgi:1-pyrroline-5-carboxylate dehydrogenase